LQTIFQYDDYNMLWEHATGIDSGPYGRTEGIAFIGNNGTLVVNRQGYEVLVEHEAQGYSTNGKAKMESIEAYQKPNELNYLDLHTKNFVEAIRKNSQDSLNTPIKSGAVAAVNAQMGNIAYKTGSKVFWDQKSKTFKDNPAANKLILADYQNGWKIPSV
jgi:hypothetical protein